MANLESVEKQFFKDYEHVFIDGESDDGTLNILKEYIANNAAHAKIAVYDPQGIANAMNKGIMNASGEYIIHLHSDDSFYSSDVLEAVHDFLAMNGYPDMLYGKINVIKETRETVGQYPLRKIYQKQNTGLLKYINYIPHQAVFIKREIFEKHGYFDETLSSQQEYDYWLKNAVRMNFLFYDKLISNYMIRADAQSSSRKNLRENDKVVRSIRKRYLNALELMMAKVVAFGFSFFRKTIS